MSNSQQSYDRRLGVWAALALALVGLPSSAQPADDVAAITVTGDGEVTARPDRLVINLSVSGGAELLSDAIVKYQDSSRRVMEVFEGLKLDGLSIDKKELLIGSAGSGASGMAGVVAMADVAGGGAQPGQPMTISQDLVLTLDKIGGVADEELLQTISRLLDTAKDSGATVAGGSASGALMARMMGVGGGPASSVTFVVSNPDDHLEKAYEAAFAAARRRAESLAKLADVRLGRVLSMDEVAAGDSDPASLQEQVISSVYGIESSASSTRQARISSEKLGDIPVRISLRVRFAIHEEASP